MKNGLPVVITDGPYKGVKGVVFRSQKSDDSQLIWKTLRVIIPPTATKSGKVGIFPRAIVSPVCEPKVNR